MKHSQEARLLGAGLMLLFPAMAMAWLGWLSAVGFVAGGLSVVMAAIFVSN
jgi:hypothetical protein